MKARQNKKGENMKWLSGKKTHLSAILLALHALVPVFAGDLSVVDFLQSDQLVQLLAAFGLSSLRSGVAKGQKK